MAFCTSCGAPLDDRARSCPKCGATVAPAAPAVSTTGPAAMRQPAGSNALRIVLIVVAAVFALGICATIASVIVLKNVAHRVRVDAGPNSTTVTTPFGSVTTDDPAVVARNLGVEVYPGARGIKGGASVGFGNMQVAAAKFESDDAPGKIMDFYQRRYPKANVRVVGRDNSMVLSTNQGMITIKVHARGDGSLLEIARVSGVGGGSNDDDSKPN
jgi:zinc-ribbon domain